MQLTLFLSVFFFFYNLFLGQYTHQQIKRWRVLWEVLCSLCSSEVSFRYQPCKGVSSLNFIIRVPTNASIEIALRQDTSLTPDHKTSSESHVPLFYTPCPRRFANPPQLLNGNSSGITCLAVGRKEGRIRRCRRSWEARRRLSVGRKGHWWSGTDCPWDTTALHKLAAAGCTPEEGCCSIGR